MTKSILQISDIDVEKRASDIQTERTSVDEIARLIDAECKFYLTSYFVPLSDSKKWNG